uniref:Uncharacterized protein n=1 Tax=Magallana gigas TaxID=29159 RepID=K1Q1C1_MAGGI
MLEDPRKDKYLKHSSGYSSYIYNCMVSSKDSKDIGESTRMTPKRKTWFDKSELLAHDVSVTLRRDCDQEEDGIPSVS